jgi:two-component sensor histidine kinase
MLHLVEPSPGHPSGTLVSTIADRQTAVHRYEILDTPPEAAFDRITALAADLFDAPISIIGLRDRDRLWFKSHHGLDATELGLSHDDTSASVTELRIRRKFNLGFFVGVPLHTSDGHDLGSLCVMDRPPRRVDEQRRRHLKALADFVVDHLELRRARVRATARAALMAREFDHRAMNSLQFVASLLHLQSRLVGTEAAGQLTAAENRVLAAARVHQSFAADEAADLVNVLAYLGQLCSDLSTVLGAHITVAGSEGGVPTTQILAIGVIVNELVTNAKKHGAGPVTVTFRSGAAGRYELCVLEEGEGLPDGFTVDQHRVNGIGMKVVTALVKQLAGRLSAHANPAGQGACFSVLFPIATIG